MAMQQKDVESVRVAVRCRPLSDDEKAGKYESIVVVDQLRGQITVHVPNARTKEERERSFIFDSVFGADVKQTDVYNETSRPIADAVLEGYNGTIFAYGQTGTGKTFTMAGKKDVPELRGIIPNSFAHIFGHIAKCGEGVQFLVRVSYLEIYREEVRDLLSKNHTTRLEVRERVDVGVYVKDLTSFVVKSPEEMDKLMFIGDKNRMVGPTDMNEHSSRSHTIFTITVERSEMGPDHQQHLRMGKLHLVDLAGSERQTKTNATGDRLKEAIQINLSLSTLGNVISALVDGKSTHIPYRNSKLTRLLQDSLGGNSKTIMIANIGPANYNCEETLNTLRYASRAKNIQNKAHINEDPKDAMLREFQKEIEELRKKLEEEGANGSDPQGGGPKDQASGGGGLTPRQAAALRAKIEQERQELLGKKDLVQSERDKAQQELERRESEIKKAQEQHEALEQKLAALQNKVIVGGVNLLEKAEEQERLLEESEKKLEKRRKKEEELRQQLKQKEAERQDIEGKYASLQEEAAAKTAKLKEMWKQFQAAKEELADMKAEFQRENEDTLESIRQTSRELKLQLMTINHFIPKEYQDLLDAHVVWHEDTGEWHVQGIAYAGNNMKRQPSPENVSTQQHFDWSDTSSAYLIYHVGSQEVYSLVPGKSDSSASGRSSKAGKKPSTEKAKVSQRKASDAARVQPVAEEEKQQEYPTSRGLISKQKHFA